ncbi:ribosome silencing factor [Cupriavidus necator]|uniref:ribosome silencing factor n=1 Tax=Cupriavidus necator TaxID=106590 RepID=UPI0014903DBD|nr:ribosome silencing factor [Cupriavidus necator]MDQ0142480.1 ribosome-associated protein [Cupriavidus necator]NOV25815.1 ribosome silencing factor [Cupriavidus necator]
MDIRKLQRAIVDGLEDVKAQDIKVYDTSHLTELFDRVVIASGTSNRQTKALAASVRDTVKEAGGHIVAVEGLETGEWVLVDCGDAVVHILQPQLRLYYNLEEIWGDKPVRMKLAAGTRLAKASEPMDEDEDEAPVRTVRRASNLRPALARLPEGMKEPSPPMGHEDTDADAIATIRKPARKAAAKSPATKATGTRAAAPRKTAAGTTARKTATKTATKTAAKKAPAKTAAAKPVARKRATRSA